MIDREKYNESIQEIINDLEELKITDENSSMCEVDRVTCLGGVMVSIENLGEDLEEDMANPALGGKSKREIEEGK